MRRRRRSVFGVGIDIVQIQRFERLWERSGSLLAETILTPDELESFAAAAEPARFLALRFAAKEAIAKAVGTGFSSGLWISDIGSIPDRDGGTRLSLTERGSRKFKELGIGGGSISFSHGSGLIFAMALLMRESV